MKNVKKILLTRELHELTIVRSRQFERRFFCRGCRTESAFFTLDEAVNFFGVGTREILRKTETGEIHAFDAPNGQLLVCGKSFGGQFVRREKEV